MKETNDSTSNAMEMRAAMQLLDKLLPMSDADRDITLKQILESQPQVHALVVALLRADREASGSGFLEPPRPNTSETRSENGVKIDTQLGPYRIIKQLGAGGMGEVWLARRVDGRYEGNVAIKTLHPHLANTALRERFTREAQILGKLTHKNIAGLHDAGVSDQGVAYLVLEYVHGETIDTWCDARSLSIRARLELFLSVCAAVAHAHAHLVVHRDLKPSNILVTDSETGDARKSGSLSGDRSGNVKLLDFGVAKLVQGDQGAVESTALTQFGGRIFTPEYASPEQILGESVTTATDVYALGVLLYVLLSGKRPFGSSTTTGQELERAILNSEPMSLATLPIDYANLIAQRRTTTPVKLRRELKGDLEYIVRRALRKSPKDRYGSVLALAVDIERYLRQQPIDAREGSGLYRLGRLMQRHRAAAVATIVSITALMIGSGVAIWQLQVARNEARKATAIKDFVIDVFERNSVTNLDGADARKTTAEELLAQSAKQIRSDLRQVPEVRAEMLNVISELYSALEMQTEAIELRQEELAELRKLHGANSIEVGRSLAMLAAHQAQVGDYTQAEKSGLESARILRAAGDDSSLALARAYGSLAQSASRMGKNQDPATTGYFEGALNVYEKYHPRDPMRIGALLAIARHATLRKLDQESLRYCEQALDLIERKIVDVSDYDRGAVYQVMSVRLRGVRRYDDAEKFIERAAQTFEKSIGANHPFTIDAHRERGSLLYLIGRRTEARPILEESVAALERTKGADDPELTTNARIYLAQLLIARGELGLGEKQIVHAHEIVLASKAKTLEVPTRLTLARVQIAQGKIAAAQQTLDGMESLAVNVGGEQSLRHMLALARLGQLALANKQYDQAEKIFSKVIGWRDTSKHLSSGVANAELGLVRLSLARNEIDNALKRSRQLVKDIEISPERMEMPDAEADAHLLLGAVLSRSGDAVNAKLQLTTALAARERMDASESPWLAEVRLHYAQALQAANELPAARRQLQLAELAFAKDVALGAQYTTLLADTRSLLSRK